MVTVQIDHPIRDYASWRAAFDHDPAGATGGPHVFERTFSASERAHLRTLATAHTLPYSHVRRTRLIFAGSRPPSDALRAGFSHVYVSPAFVGKAALLDKLLGRN